MATIKGNDGSNTVGGTADGDLIYGYGGADRLSGGDGADILYGDDDMLAATFGSGNDRLSGGAGRDVLVGGAGGDALSGDDGDDLLIGGFASGVVNDGANFGYGFSPFADGGDDSYDGGAGFDTAILSFDRAAAIAFGIATPAPHAITADGVRIGTIRGVEAIRAYLGSGDDVVTGGASGDELSGRGGDDTLVGGAGGDRIEGGAGNDRLDGGEGYDVLDYADAAAGVVLDLRLAGQAQDTRGSGVDTFTGFEQVDGSNFSDRITGSDAADSIYAGNGGSDRLSGGAGDDRLSIYRFRTDAPTTSTLNGGDGDDMLSTAAASGATDRFSLLGGAGRDTAYVTVSGVQSVNLGSGEDRLVLRLGSGEVAAALGAGVDTVAFEGFGGVPDTQVAAHIVDFRAGNNGDRVDLRDLLAGAATGYQAGANPFATGHARLVTSDTGTALQFDADGEGNKAGFVTILELDGTQPAAFNAFNFGGTDPRAVASPLPSHHPLAWPDLAHIV